MTNKLIKHDFIKHFVSSMFNTMTFSANTIFVKTNSDWRVWYLLPGNINQRIVYGLFPLFSRLRQKAHVTDQQRMLNFPWQLILHIPLIFVEVLVYSAPSSFPMGLLILNIFPYDNSFIRYKMCSGWHSLLFFVICQ